MSNIEKTAPLPDQPLPEKLTAKLGSWSVRAQHYPIFSQTWFRYRALSFALPMVVLAFILGSIAVLISLEPKVSPNQVKPHLMFLVIYLGIAINLLLGRWLACQVRRRRWSAKKEKYGIAAVLVIGIALSFGITESADRVLEKKVTQSTPVKKEEAKKIINNEQVQFGVIITDEPPKSERKAGVVNLVFWLILMIWWGGAFDYVAYLKQGRALEEAMIQEKLEKYKRERNQAQMRLSVLASQVEPHFLFNTLSGVRAAMLSDPARGVVIIDHLVDYLRSTIPQMRDDGNLMLTTVQNQFESVRAYLGVIHTRIPRLSFSIECPTELKDCVVPPLMLISLVENAVKHGIEPKKGPVEIVVTARKEKKQNASIGEELVLSVADNGVGFGTTSSGTGIGLTNIRERLKQLYGDDAALTLNMREQGGIEASIRLPLSFDLNLELENDNISV
ncbi:histidine kinase [Undibacterium sp. LX40W]|uniref:Histidine kinase n=1 Tax=Undibacterium nitidum TaxID=2762298 RepID=A0A923HP26_9BURK|nr:MULTISPECIES: histidine kinase [Undibacterium]MBC3881361.1 histidine kinase [Undibacterium nitidum]MBC3891856.1 histidine kinase [Undibacterium sp. LX40W]